MNAQGLSCQVVYLPQLSYISFMFLRICQIAIPFIWFGAVGAISFMEAPLKFTAPNIDLPLGLGIGYIVFHALNKVEIVLCVLAAAIFLSPRLRPRLPLTLFAIIAVILILQTVWLFPLLDERTMKVISGEARPYSNLHVVYIVFDSIKVILLLALGVTLTKHALKQTPESSDSVG